jgi:hypothetical protein
MRGPLYNRSRLPRFGAKRACYRPQTLHGKGQRRIKKVKSGVTTRYTKDYRSRGRRRESCPSPGIGVVKDLPAGFLEVGGRRRLRFRPAVGGRDGSLIFFTMGTTERTGRREKERISKRALSDRRRPSEPWSRTGEYGARESSTLAPFWCCFRVGPFHSSQQP